MAVDLQEIHGGREVIYAFFAKLLLEPTGENEYKMMQEILPLLKDLEGISETAGKEIEKLEKLLLKTDRFDDNRIRIIKNFNSSFDVNACPGSGKTTILLAK